MNIVVNIFAFFLALTVTIVYMPPFIRLMTKYKILDKSGGRKIHTGYTAHMGGIVIFLALMTAIFAMTMIYYDNIVKTSSIISLGATLLIMVFVGIRDDMNNLKPITKLLCEIIVGGLLCFLNIRVTTITGFTPDQIIKIPEIISYGITICLFVVVANAYNLIDGIDGQAGMQAINTFLFIFFFFLFVVYHDAPASHPFSIAFITLFISAILGSIAGFLKFNWQKATIFMGDTGSLFIGTLITITILLGMRYCNEAANRPILLGMTIKSYAAPFLGFFYLPMADTLRVFISRARKGKSPFSPDKTHIHHYFLRLGYSHQRCTLTTFFISFTISVVSVFLAFLVTDLVFIAIIILSWFLYVKLLHLFIIKRVLKMEESIRGGEKMKKRFNLFK